MAMEYIYVDCGLDNGPIELKNFKGLRYRREYDGLEIIDSKGEVVASFYVKLNTCYLLQRRNQSALQLHEVTPPRFCMDELVWLFGFGRKQHCENYEGFTQTWKDYQNAHSDQQVIEKRASFGGSCLNYAFVFEDSSVKPIAYYYEMASSVNWAFNGKETEYRFVYELHNALHGFKYPLQYVIHLFKGLTLSYPVETRKFFHERLGYKSRKDVYYADLPGIF